VEGEVKRETRQDLQERARKAEDTGYWKAWREEDDNEDEDEVF
jgi:hypothetical protein